MDKELFLIGAATAGGQVEGNNINSDIWAQEHMQTAGYKETSGDAADHYHTFREDIRMMSEAGLNSYRFSFEWARIEPQKGVFDENEMNHYLDMVDACREYGIEPVITLLHFSCPKWLITEGGWEADTTPDYFVRYTEYVAEHLKEKDIHYIVTINEANMGTLIAGYLEKIRKHTDGGGLQIGMDLKKMTEKEMLARKENQKVFGVDNAAVFTSPRTKHGDEIVCLAHMKAVEKLHRILPKTKVGLSLSVRDIQYIDGGKENADREWVKEFLHYLPVIEHDDFLGVQTYTRAVFSANAEVDPTEKRPITQMGYENYPECVEHVIRRIHESFKGDLLITENGIATENDTERIRYIEAAMNGILSCRKDELPVKGYLYWSFIDNWEWQSGYYMQFGLVSLDRQNQIHKPKASLAFLGSYKLIK